MVAVNGKKRSGNMRLHLTEVLPLFRSVFGIGLITAYVSVPPSSKMAAVFWNRAVVFVSKLHIASLLSVVL